MSKCHALGNYHDNFIRTVKNNNGVFHLCSYHYTDGKIENNHCFKCRMCDDMCDFCDTYICSLCEHVFCDGCLCFSLKKSRDLISCFPCSEFVYEKQISEFTNFKNNFIALGLTNIVYRYMQPFL